MTQADLPSQVNVDGSPLAPRRRRVILSLYVKGIFRPMPAFSLFAILDIEGLRLRLRQRCGLFLNRNPQFLEGHDYQDYFPTAH
jgi:hypothetical protein